jgi:tRNA(adenine34) deaminase
MSYDCGRPRGLSRRSVVTGFVAAAAMPMASAGLEAPAAHPTAEDERFMRMAIEEARRADFPFGAVIVRNGRVIARGRNLGRRNDDPTAHGEMVAIRRCLDRYGRSRAQRSTRQASRARCAWAQSCGATWAGWCSRRRSSNSPPGSTRSWSRAQNLRPRRRSRRSRSPAGSWPTTR